MVNVYVIPLSIPIITALIGWVTNVPWFNIWIGCIASFSLFFFGLLNLTKWLYRIEVENKVAFSAVRFCSRTDGKGISIGFVLCNLADFPISFEIPSLVVRLKNKVPNLDHKGGAIYTMPAKGTGWYDSYPINIDAGDIPESGAIEGYIEFTINYGKAKKSLNKKFSAKKQLVVNFNKDGVLQSGAWNDVV